MTKPKPTRHINHASAWLICRRLLSWFSGSLNTRWTGNLTRIHLATYRGESLLLNKDKHYVGCPILPMIITKVYGSNELVMNNLKISICTTHYSFSLVQSFTYFSVYTIQSHSVNRLKSKGCRLLSLFSNHFQVNTCVILQTNLYHNRSFSFIMDYFYISVTLFLFVVI